MKYMIQMENVSKAFDGKNIINNVSINIEQKEIFGLLGLSGAGKSTILKILTGQLKCSSGIAKVMGIECNKFDAHIYSKLGTVMEKGGLYERLSCYDNMLLFAKLHNIDKKSIYEVLEKVNLQNEHKKLAGNLSKGMWQRLLLARAILHKPDVLFLDEPTDGLDPGTAKEVREILLKMRSEGTTIFLTTHNMMEATELCDNVAFLRNGTIVEYGNPHQICKRYSNNPISLEEVFLKLNRRIDIDV